MRYGIAGFTRDAVISSHTRKPRVLVLIPAYNEEENVAEVVDGVRRAVESADILVIDDGSVDKTAMLARRSGATVLDLPYNLGIGGAVQAGYKFAEKMGYDFVVRLDGDGQHDPDDIPRLLAPVQQGQADVSYGCRFCGGVESFHTSPARRLGIRMFGLLVSAVVGQPIHDVTSGMRCSNRRAVQCFARHYPQDYPEVESHILLHKVGLKETEIPVIMHPRMGGKSSIRLLRSMYYALKITLAVLIRCLQTAPCLGAGG